MNERQKELFWVIVALSIPTLVMGNAVYQTYFTNIEHDIVFKVFEAECLVFKTGSKTQVLTWGSGNYISSVTGQDNLTLENTIMLPTFINQDQQDHIKT